MIYVFDIDGTLADCTHRLHFIEGKKKDYEAFYKACVDDKPIQPMINLHDHLSMAGYYFPFYVSGRPESSRRDTDAWLDKHCDAYTGYAYLRADGDLRPDYEVKLELMDRLIKDTGVTQNEIIIFEDRKRVVDAYRQAGYTVCDVAGQDY